MVFVAQSNKFMVCIVCIDGPPGVRIRVDEFWSVTYAYILSECVDFR